MTATQIRLAALSLARAGATFEGPWSSEAMRLQADKPAEGIVSPLLCSDGEAGDVGEVMRQRLSNASGELLQPLFQTEPLTTTDAKEGQGRGGRGARIDFTHGDEQEE